MRWSSCICPATPRTELNPDELLNAGISATSLSPRPAKTGEARTVVSCPPKVALGCFAIRQFFSSMPLSGYRFGYTHQLGSITANYAKVRWVKDLGLRSITVDYAYLS